MSCTRCRRRDVGICLDCGDPPVPGRIRCEICLQKKRDVVTRWRERKRAKKARTLRALREARAW